MSNLSTKDKLRLVLSAKRLAAWHAMRKEWASETPEKRNPRFKRSGKLKRCAGVVTGGTIWKQPEIIRSDKLAWD